MTLLTSVAGTVQFGDNPARPFYQVFLLSPEGQFYYIKTDNMRFI